MMRFWLLCISLLFLLYSCEKEKVTEVLSVEILSPAEGELFFIGDTIPIKFRLDTINCTIDRDFIQVDAGQSDKNVRKIGDSDYIWIASDCNEGYYTISVSVYSTSQKKAIVERQILVRDCGLPVVQTGGVFGVTDSSIKVGGFIVSDGGCPIIERGFYIGLSKHAVDTDSSYFECEITGLWEGQHYDYKAYAANDRGESFGETLDVETNYKECVVSVHLDPFPDLNIITDSSIYSFCSVNDVNNCAESYTSRGGIIFLYYSTLPDPRETGQQLSMDLDMNVCDYFLIDGLLPDTDYYVQAYYDSFPYFIHGESDVVIYRTLKSE